MKQILQEIGTGQTIVADVPAPAVPRRGLRIATRRSLISAGTERMLVEFGRSGLLAKVRQQPDKIRQVFDKVLTDGLVVTLEAVRAKLAQTVPVGYCNVGVVDDLGEAPGFSVGDRVVTRGTEPEDRQQSLYPVGLPIGHVTRIDNAGTDTQEVHLRPYADMRSLDFVQILTKPRGPSS